MTNSQNLSALLVLQRGIAKIKLTTVWAVSGGEIEMEECLVKRSVHLHCVVSGMLFVALLASLSGARPCAADDYPEAAQDATIVETLLRLEGFDINSSAKGKAAVLRYVEHNLGSERAMQLLKKYKLAEANDLLLKLASEKPTDSAGVDAARMLLSDGGEDLRAAIEKNDEASAKLVAAVGLVGDAKAAELLAPLVTDAERTNAVRSAAVSAIGRQPKGQQQLLELVVAGEIPEELKFAVASVLHGSADEKIRSEAEKLLPLPATADAQPLPPLAELVKAQGDAKHGQEVFRTKGTCANCHKVAGEGKEVGPDLSEIGNKLTREAMYIAILDPSQGISHNFESYQAILLDGTIFTGIKVSETDSDITLKSAEAIQRTIPHDEIEELIKQKISLMPAGLQKLIKGEELVDVVEYLSTLKKP
jgi:putative heme-binding domain-containing protein